MHIFVNTFSFSHAGSAYHIRSDGDLLFYTVNFDFTQEFSHLGVMTPESEKTFKCDTVLCSNTDIEEIFSDIIYMKNAPEIGKDIESIYYEVQKPDKQQYIESLYMAIVLAKLSRGKRTDGVRVPLCEEIKGMIEENLSLNIEKIAQILNYHPYYLNYVFSKNTGLTLHKYITNKRLSKARELLLTTELSIEEISRICGFCSPSHMSAVFKSAYQITPGKLRKLT